MKPVKHLASNVFLFDTGVQTTVPSKDVEFFKTAIAKEEAKAKRSKKGDSDGDSS